MTPKVSFRARNRQHVFRLRDLSLGRDQDEFFQENDEKLLDEQDKNYDNEDHYLRE